MNETMKSPNIADPPPGRRAGRKRREQKLVPGLALAYDAGEIAVYVINITKQILRSFGLRADSKTAKFPQPTETDRSRAHSGAAWRAFCGGASRCLESGCVEFAPFQFRGRRCARRNKNS